MFMKTRQKWTKKINELAKNLANSNPKSMQKLKILCGKEQKIGMKYYYKELESGKLVLSDFTKNAINSFKKNN